MTHSLSLRNRGPHGRSQLPFIVSSIFAVSKRHASSHRRPATSSSSSSNVRSSNPSVSQQDSSVADDINPPASTLPAPLDLPESLPASAAPSAKLKRYVSMGRAYVSFYKTGLKNVYYNFRTSIPLRKALGVNPYIPSTIPPSAPSSSSSGTNAFEAALKARAPSLNRSDFQLVRRAAYDFRRLIPFTLIVIICGEFTPLVVLALGSAVTPYTCRVPGQISKTQKQRAEVKRLAIAAHQARTTGSVTPLLVGSEQELDLLARKFANGKWVEEEASSEDVLRACAVFGLAKTHVRPPFLAGLVYKQRLRRYAEYLRLDDGLIVKYGGVKKLNANEVRIAIEERGGGDVGDEKVQRAWLEKWLQRREHVKQ